MSASMQWIIKGDDLKIRDISTPDRVMVHVDWREGMERHSWVVSGDAAHVVAMLDEIREPFAAELRCTEADYDAAEARYDERIPFVAGDRVVHYLGTRGRLPGTVVGLRVHAAPVNVRWDVNGQRDWHAVYELRPASAPEVSVVSNRFAP